MKFDMAGAATSVAALRAIAALGLPVHVTAWLCTVSYTHLTLPTKA